MSIKFTDTGTATAIQMPDSDNLTIPNGDFTLATLIYTDGVLIGSSQQHLINAGNTFSAGHIALILEAGGQVNGQTDVNQSGVSSTHQTPLEANKAYLIGLQRTGTTVRSFFCPVLQTMPTDGSAVLMSTKSRSLNVALNLTSALTIGHRGAAANRATHSMSRAFCYVGTLSALDLAKIAHGMDLLDMGKVPLWYVRMNDGSDTADLGPNANPTSRSTGATALPTGTPITLGYVSTNRPPTITKPVLGSPVQVGTSVGFTTGTADGYPYPTVTQQWLVDGVDVVGAAGLTYIPTANDENKFLSVRQTATSQQGVASATSDPVQIIPSVNALYLTPPPTHWMTQHVNGVAPVPFSFTYTGVQPATIEYALYDPDGTLRVDWAAAGATIVPGGTGNATPNMPAGAKKYRLAIRGKTSGGAVLATSATSDTTFGVGELIGMVGSSSAETWGYRITGAIDPEICSQHRDGAWYMPDRETYGTRMGRYIRSIRGYVVGIIHAGVGGTGLSGATGWQAESSSLFQGFKSAVLMSGGKLGGLFVSVGSNDAGSGGLINKAVHVASMRSLIQNTRNLTGQPNLPVLWSGYNRRAAELGQPNFSASSDVVREAEKVVGSDPYVYHVQALDYELHQDNVHLTGQGFLDCTSRMSYVYCEALAGRYRRGPKISSLKFSGNNLFLDVIHRNGTDLSPATGGVGITVTDASGTPTQVSTQRVSANRYSATYDRPLVAPVVAKFLSGGAPDWITPIMDNGTVPLPMEVETEMATVADDGQVVIKVSNDLSATYSIDAPAPVYVRSDLQGIYSIGTTVVTVATSRVAKFAGRKRVVKFEATDPAYRGGKWYVQKGINDELFYAGDVAKQLTEAGTTVSSVSVIATGVTAITPPTFQGSLLVVKLGGFNIASDNYVTFRVVCANGERFDRTIIFERSLDDVIFKKDPDDQLFYAVDVSEMLTSGVTTAVSFQTIPVGVQLLSSLAVQGAVMPALIGGLDTAGSSNSATFRVTCANGERFDKTIKFEREEM